MDTLMVSLKSIKKQAMGTVMANLSQSPRRLKVITDMDMVAALVTTTETTRVTIMEDMMRNTAMVMAQKTILDTGTKEEMRICKECSCTFWPMLWVQ
jgi:hypothetical protein